MFKELKYFLDFEDLKVFLDSDLFITFVTLRVKSEKLLKRITNSYLIRFVIFLMHRKGFIKR